MQDIIEIALGIVLGVIIGYWFWNFFKQKNNKERTQKQSVILIDKIKKVCKFITVEGDFSEIYHYENTSEYLFKLVPSKKKALLIIKEKQRCFRQLRSFLKMSFLTMRLNI